MINLYIGNYERVIGRSAYIKENGIFTPCKITGYLFKGGKYQVATEDQRNMYVKKIYIEY